MAQPVRNRVFHFKDVASILTSDVLIYSVLNVLREKKKKRLANFRLNLNTHAHLITGNE